MLSVKKKKPIDLIYFGIGISLIVFIYYLKISEIIVRSLNQPSVTDVNIEGNTINLTVHKEMGVEVVGDETIKISVEDEYDDYEEIIDEEEIKNETDNIDINEDYLK